MRLINLYLTNLWGVMNDNVLKILVCFVAVAWVPPAYADLVVNLSAGMLVLPYLLFSPLAGRLAGSYGRLAVLRASKAAELPIMLVAVAGFLLQSVCLCLGAVLLMGVQSAIYSPSKYGLIKDIVGEEGVSEGMGGMEAVAFIGMLFGSVAAACLSDYCGQTVWFAVLIGLALLGWACSHTVKAPLVRETAAVSGGFVGFFRESRMLMRKYRGLNAVVHYLSVFWWMSASLQIILIIHCQAALGLSATQTGVLLALLAVGISSGCVVGGIIDRRLNLVGISPLFGLLLAVLLAATFFCSHSLVAFSVLLFAVAFVGGLFKIPLDAEIQKRVAATELSSVLAYFNQVSFCYIFLASATNLLITSVLGLSTSWVFLLLGVALLAASLLFIFCYRPAICQVGRFFMHAHYDVEEQGRQVLQTARGENLLILPSHRAVLDPLLLFAEMHDVAIQPLCDEGYFRIPGIGHVLGLFDAVEVPDLRKSRRDALKARGLKDVIIDALHKGGNILFYPAGHITTDGGESIGTRQLAHEACANRPAKTRVIGVRITGLWGSRWSRFGRKETPDIVLLLLKSFCLIFSGAIFFMRKRKLTIEYVDVTASTDQWAALPRVEFNQKLEAFYQEAWGGEEEKPVRL